jgi:hypothetical protein
MDTSHLAFLTIGASGLSLPLLVVGVTSILLHTSRQSKQGDQEERSLPVKGLISTGLGIVVLFAACIIGADSSSFSVVSLIAALLGILIIAVVGVVYYDGMKHRVNSRDSGLSRLLKRSEESSSEPNTSLLHRIWSWIQILCIASLRSLVVGGGVAVVGSISVIFAGIPFGVGLMISGVLGFVISIALFVESIKEGRAQFDLTGTVTFPEKLVPRGFLGFQSGALEGSHSREDYRRCGATDEDIDFWGLDEPGAPPPEVAGWAVWEVLEEMDGGPDDMDFDMDFDIDL